MAQHYTSADTSINTKQLPAIYSKLESLVGKAQKPNHSILDIGCGKETSHIQKKCRELGWEYIGYDPYNQTEAQNSMAMLAAAIFPVSFAILSNVVNVIDDDQAMLDAIKMGINNSIARLAFVTIYEGDRTGVGRVTKRDCYQRNMKRKDYLPLFESANLYCMRIPNGYAISDRPFKTKKNSK